MTLASENSSKRKRAIGESRIWLSAAALSIGIIMIAGLLGIIAKNGFMAFWPHDIELLHVKSANGSNQLAGQLVQERDRKTATGELVPEEQYFLGSREAFGESFKYIDVSKIEEKSRPSDLMVLERMEYGDAILRPEVLTLANGTKLPATASDFNKKLRQVVDETTQLREEILKLEKRDLGRINSKMEAARKAILRLQKQADATEDAAIASKIENKRQEVVELQEEYNSAHAKVEDLRKKLNQNSLEAELIGKGKVQIPDSQMVDFHLPNQMGFWDRLGFTFRQFGRFLSDNPREANTDGGIFPAIFGTFIMTILMSAAVTPFGVITAIYLREYAKQGTLVKIVRICVNNLAGVPSIVFGIFGLGFFVYFIGGNIDNAFFSEQLPLPTFGTPGLLWASLTMALMTLPVVIVSTEESLLAIPRGIREAALACGASKWQMIQRILLPSAMPGILTGLILAMARGAGEVAPLMLTGVVKLAPDLPIDLDGPFIHAERKFMHLGFHIFDVGFHAPDSEAAKPMVFATALLLIVLVLVMNLSAIMLRSHLRKRLQVSQF